MNNITKKKYLLEGKTKKIYSTDNTDEIIIHYKDSITALDGLKKELLQDKGILNNEITTLIFKFLKDYGVKTHFIRKINNREQLCYKVDIIPLEFVVRNVVAGSMSKRLGIKEGITIDNPIIEIFYKNDVLKDPWINDHHAVFLGIISYEELNKVNRIVSNINNILKKYFLDKNIILVDFKIEFGKDKKNQILLSDEISPDTCRLWDKKTMKKLDKDKFRNEFNEKEEVIDTYMEILKRLNAVSSI
ncbi:phosphoribosylaminoimidazolesuccinocarboxamide synthase [Blattabacterium sp. (Cryptocercus kyebangensis)]|uniref:phosphoribosylaminoimidazolesuccinocarboxamide synthase n=1 Tax=Blattabacterium sp. (Cryptocercus kyebangensis) TaxID=298656 RepID=UPI000D7CF57E|nr:phosphoribosylaminoimidazolesuccinocarboxamide synthase [Blattabacterium sp. (Cryptocercus kyebangensis)]AWU44038.1 phosphoribosylaminoimidazolesuccinocarboxamide synthase [Blattabacterium sp. (Cryptocercus kyebangensis)]